MKKLMLVTVVLTNFIAGAAYADIIKLNFGRFDALGIPCRGNVCNQITLSPSVTGHGAHVKVGDTFNVTCIFTPNSGVISDNLVFRNIHYITITSGPTYESLPTKGLKSAQFSWAGTVNEDTFMPHTLLFGLPGISPTDTTINVSCENN